MTCHCQAPDPLVALQLQRLCEVLSCDAHDLHAAERDARRARAEARAAVVDGRRREAAAALAGVCESIPEPNAGDHGGCGTDAPCAGDAHADAPPPAPLATALSSLNAFGSPPSHHVWRERSPRTIATAGRASTSAFGSRRAAATPRSRPAAAPGDGGLRRRAGRGPPSVIKVASPRRRDHAPQTADAEGPAVEEAIKAEAARRAGCLVGAAARRGDQ